MYLAWSMTYFHINLDPRGKKKSFAANSYTRGYIVFLFFLLGFFFLCSFWIFWVLFFFLFWAGFSKTRLQGGAWGDHSAIRGPEGAASGLRGSGLRRPAESPLRGGLPSSPACTLFLFVVFFFFRCSVLTRVLFQNTCVECVSLCAQEHTPL